MSDPRKLKNPYVGPVSFTFEDRHLFFGREREGKRLKSLGIAERVLLFYAESGAGKTSLMNAFLIPALREKNYEVLPVVRVGVDLPPKFTYDFVYNVYAFNVLRTLTTVSLNELAAKPLVSLFREKLLGIDFEKPHWLFIDQFEEIVTTHVVQRDKRVDFFDQLRELLEADRSLSVVLIMREDHLAEVDDYAPLLPGRLSTRQRMERLNRAAALDAVRLPAERNEEGHRRLFPKEVARLLVEDLSQLRSADQEAPIRGDHVEPMQLQVVCYSLWEKLNEAALRGEDTSTITEEHLRLYAKVDETLENFYDDCIARVLEQSPKVREEDIRRWFGEKLITTSRIRAQVNRGYLSSGDLPNKVVDLLHDRHLIRAVDARGGKWYELSHDRFIIPILNSNGKRATAGVSPLEIAGAAQNWESADRDESFLYRGALLRKAQAEYLPRIERLSSLEREFLTASIDAQSRQSRVAYVMLGVTFILLVFATAGSWYALYKNREYKTEKQKLLAQQETNDELLSVVAGGMDKVNSAELQTLLEHTGERPQPPTTEAPQPEPTPTATPEAQIFVTTNALVGPVRWELGGGGDVQYLDGWDARNIETVDIPQLRGVPGAGSGRVQFYRGAAAQLKAAWAEVEDAGLLGRVKVWNGSFARKAIGKSRLSVHALGLAFDINYDDNRTGRTPPLEGEEGSVRELVPIFKRHGFAWSGDNRIPDGSHFEVERIVTGPEVSGPGGAPYLKRDWKAPSSESIIRARYSMAVATFWR